NMAGVALASNYVWNFTTGAIVAPRVILTDPFNTETGVLLNKVVTATFDMAMDPLTITTSTFTLKQGTDVILGSVSYSGNMASFTPNNPLLANAVFTATITTGAKNVAGVAIANNYVWTFTTINSSNAPDLGSASPFGAFGGNAGITNQGINTVINGSIATTAASTLVTGFHDATAIYTETPLNVGNVTGAISTAPPMPGTATSFAIAQQALLDANAAYLSISPASMPGGIDPGAGELGGLTLAPGIYKSDSGTFNISNGNLTLDAQGDPNAVWVFQTASGLTVGIAGPTGAKSVTLINGALPKNVFWYVGSSAVINGAGGGTMVGTIIANSGVTLSTAGNTVQTVLNGRAISLISSVTMVNTTINVPQ
ncbi:MAG: ice-binding family protein, partial [Flavobacterium sp.]